MHAFDDQDCDLLAKALDRAYLGFVAGGKLNEANIDIAKSVLSRAIMHSFQLGERDEFKLAKHAQTTFQDYIDDISHRDLGYLKGTTAIEKPGQLP